MFVDENAIQTSEKPTIFTIQTIKKGINYGNEQKKSIHQKFNFTFTFQFTLTDVR